MKTYDQYREELFCSNHHYFGEAALKKQREEYEELLFKVVSKQVKPSKVIGSGYKYPYKAAVEWLTKNIQAIAGYIESRGDMPLMRSNYDYNKKFEPQKLEEFQQV